MPDLHELPGSRTMSLSAGPLSFSPERLVQLMKERRSRPGQMDYDDYRCVNIHAQQSIKEGVNFRRMCLGLRLAVDRADGHLDRFLSPIYDPSLAFPHKWFVDGELVRQPDDELVRPAVPINGFQKKSPLCMQIG